MPIYRSKAGGPPIQYAPIDAIPNKLCSLYASHAAPFLVGFGNSTPEKSNEYQRNSHWSNPMKLRRNEYCPIHRSLFCCGREHGPKERRFQLGVQRIEDPHHPRGYRELRSPAEMRKLLNRKIADQGGKCSICHESFTEYGEIVPDHIVV